MQKESMYMYIRTEKMSVHNDRQSSVFPLGFISLLSTLGTIPETNNQDQNNETNRYWENGSLTVTANKDKRAIMLTDIS